MSLKNKINPRSRQVELFLGKRGPVDELVKVARKHPRHTAAAAAAVGIASVTAAVVGPKAVDATFRGVGRAWQWLFATAEEISGDAATAPADAAAPKGRRAKRPAAAPAEDAEIVG